MSAIRLARYNVEKLTKALALLKSNYRRTDVCKILDTSYSQINNLYARMKSNNISQVLSGQGAKRKFTDEIVFAFKQFIDSENNRLLSAKNIKAKFETWYNSNNHSNINFSSRTYYNYLTRKEFINYSYKSISKARFKPHANQNTTTDKLNYIRRFSFLLNLGREPIFLDESSFTIGLYPTHGYSKKHEPLYVTNQINSSTNYTLLCAITRDKVLGYKFFLGSITSDDFFNFLFQLLDRYSSQMVNSFIVLDNHSIHSKYPYIQIFEGYMPVLFLPVYSPEFNSIELLFLKVKRQLRQYYLESCFQMFHEIEKIMNSIADVDIAFMFLRVIHVMISFVNNSNVN
jgi:transposase